MPQSHLILIAMGETYGINDELTFGSKGLNDGAQK
jgi:hypothetical protein